MEVVPKSAIDMFVWWRRTNGKVLALACPVIWCRHVDWANLQLSGDVNVSVRIACVTWCERVQPYKKGAGIAVNETVLRHCL